MNMATQAVSSGIVKGRLDGKVCLITGAGSGQGQCTALLFAEAGATVLASDIQQEGLEQTRDLAAEKQLTIETRVVDAASEEQVQQWVGDAVLAHRRIDVLYNNAAGVHMAPFA